MQNTYLPRRQQPGFMHEVEKISSNTPIASEMLLYSARHLETDKLYYLFRSYLNTEDSDEKFLVQEAGHIAVSVQPCLFTETSHQFGLIDQDDPPMIPHLGKEMAH